MDVRWSAQSPNESFAVETGTVIMIMIATARIAFATKVSLPLLSYIVRLSPEYNINFIIC